MDNGKEFFKAMHLRNAGTLDETDDYYSFEETWARFQGAMSGAFGRCDATNKAKGGRSATAGRKGKKSGKPSVV